MTFSANLYTSGNKNSTINTHLLEVGKVVKISENDFIYFEIISTNPFPQNCFLWLSDFRFPLNILHYSDSGFHYSINLSTFFAPKDLTKFSNQFFINNNLTSFYKIFLNHYGECKIELEGLNEEEITEIAMLNVVSDKISEIDFLLEYLLEKDQYYWNSVSLTRIEASDKKRDTEDYNWTLKNILSSINVIQKYFLPNIIDSMARLVPKHSVNPITSNSVISEESILWLLENCNVIEPSDIYEENSFLVLNRPFIVNEMMTQRLEKNTDISENQVIHGYILDVSTFTQSSIFYINQIIIKLDKLDDFKSHIFKSYYKRLLSTTLNIEYSLGNIRNAIVKNIPVTRSHLNVGQLNRFKSKQHYYEIYLEISKWLNRSEAIFSPDSFFSGAKDISKLYEIFCLFKIIDTISNDLGFNLTECSNKSLQVEDFQNPFKNKDKPLKNRYEFTNLQTNIKLKLFYDYLPDSLITVAKTSGSYRPDFTIEIEDKISKKYIIFDAKYKRIGTIQEYDYQDISLKYLHGIGLKSGGHFPILGLFMINPIANSNIGYYQAHKYSEDTISLPLIGRIEMNIHPNSTNYFKDVLLKLMNINNIFGINSALQ